MTSKGDSNSPSQNSSDDLEIVESRQHPAVMRQRLSLEECRNLIGPSCQLSDEELEKLRDSMYGLADIVIEAFLEKGDREKQEAKKSGSGSTGTSTVDNLTDSTSRTPAEPPSLPPPPRTT